MTNVILAMIIVAAVVGGLAALYGLRHSLSHDSPERRKNWPAWALLFVTNVVNLSPIGSGIMRAYGEARVAEWSLAFAWACTVACVTVGLARRAKLRQRRYARWGAWGALALALLPVFGGGCSPITPEIINAMKDDHSSITIEIPTPWGLNKITRTNPRAPLP